MGEVLDLFHQDPVPEKQELLKHPKNLCQLLVGDARKILGGLPDGFFQTVVTSPPYWGLRDYGIKGQIGPKLT